MRPFLILALALCMLPFASAQTGQWCATDGAAIEPYLDANIRTMVALQRGAIKYIPLTFHLVAASNGTGRVTEENVLLQVANLNAQYADQDAIFYIDRFSYFDSDAVYENPTESEAVTLMQSKRDNNSINVFITNNIGGGPGGGVALGVYITPRDWIIVTRGNINLTNSTLSHEIGHFFIL